MLLAIDVGNTNVTIGVFDGGRLAHSWRLAALRERTADELGIFVTRLFEQMHVPAAAVHGIAVANVLQPDLGLQQSGLVGSVRFQNRIDLGKRLGSLALDVLRQVFCRAALHVDKSMIFNGF